MKCLLTLILLLSGVCKSRSQEFNTDQKFIEICKTIASIESIIDTTFQCNYNNKQMLFISSNTTYIINPDININMSVDSTNIAIWSNAKLFFNNICYWIEFKEIVEENDAIFIKLRGYNSVENSQRKPIIKGEVMLKFTNGKYMVTNTNIKSGKWE